NTQTDLRPTWLEPVRDELQKLRLVTSATSLTSFAPTAQIPQPAFDSPILLSSATSAAIRTEQPVIKAPQTPPVSRGVRPSEHASVSSSAKRSRAAAWTIGLVVLLFGSYGAMVYFQGRQAHEPVVAAP